MCAVWVGEEGMEIKRQITGMMRLLSDKSGRVYQRTATEQDSTTKEPLGRHLSWPQQPAPLPGDQQCNSWNAAGNPGPSPSSISINSPNSPGSGQQGTCSKATRINITNDLNKVHESKGRTQLYNMYQCKGINWCLWVRKISSGWSLDGEDGQFSPVQCNLPV